jgi:1-acyl-sn-glycerol-3-phosphate acyltransferase
MKSVKDFFNVLSGNQTSGASATQKVFGLGDTDPEILVYRVLPHFLMEVARKYFRLEVEGIENIPKRGPALLTPNHSGYSGFDAFLLAHEVFKSTGRVPRILAHHLWFLSKATSIPAEKVGFIEANTANAMAQLNKNNLVVIFPEGEYGNFKPTMKRYHLQEFKRGFIRMALQKQCPIVPTLILGAEETHINLAQLKFTKYLRGLVLPLPLNVIPLPAKWKFVFLPPIYLPYKPEAADDRDLVEELASDIRERMQKAISEEAGKRGSIFFSD